MYILLRSKHHLFCALLLAGGCMSGGKIYERDLARDTSGPAYEITECRGISDGAVVDSPVLTFHLVNADGKSGLFERSNTATGTLITNRWSTAGLCQDAGGKDTSGKDIPGVVFGVWRQGGAEGPPTKVINVRCALAP